MPDIVERACHGATDLAVLFELGAAADLVRVEAAVEVLDHAGAAGATTTSAAAPHQISGTSASLELVAGRIPVARGSRRSLTLAEHLLLPAAFADLISRTRRFYEHDAADRRVAWTDRLTTWSRRVYDAQGRVVRVETRGADGAPAPYDGDSFTYDPENNRTLYTPGGRPEEWRVYHYGPGGLVTAEEDASGSRSEQVWNAVGEKLAELDAEGGRTAYRYDAYGWVAAVNKAMDRREAAEDIAGRMAKGATPTPEEQAKIDADPRLQKNVDEQLFYRKRANEIEAGRKRLSDPPAEGGPAPPSMREVQERFRQRQEDFERQRKGEAIPGTGKRSDLQEGVKASLASYHEEVDQSLTRTERMVREFGRRMRDDLEIKPKIQDAAFRFGGEDGARIERASIGGGSVGGGIGSGGFGGGSGGGSGSGGSRGMPGRFGGSIPMPRGGGGRFGGGSAGGGIEPGAGGHKAPSNAEGKDNVASWLAFAQKPVDQGGLGLTKEQAHGLVAGMQGESGVNLDPAAWNGNDRGKPAGGTAQWRDDRLRNLQAFAKERGKDWRDRGVQQEFLRHEMVGSGAYGGGSERRAYEAIKRARTRQEALGEHVSKFERPQYADAEIRKRSQYLYGHEGGTADGGASKAPAGQAGSNGQFDPLGGAARRYTSGFGMRDHPIHGGRRMHNGQDMAAPAGTPVSAMQGGRITAISRMGDVTVTHSDGSTKTYRHIDPSGLKVGQEIEGGAQIGTLRARDPRSTGPHLHLEATDAQGRRYDPRAEIDGAGEADPGMAEAQGPRRPDDITRGTPGYVEGRDAKPRRWVQDRETQKWRPDYLNDGSDNREVRRPAGRLGRHEVGAGVVAVAQELTARAVGADQGDAGAPAGRVVVEGEAQPVRVVNPRDQPARVARDRDAVAVAVLDRGQAPDPVRLAGEPPEQAAVLEQQGVEVGKR